MNLDRIAVIRISHGICRLLCTVNPDASSPLQIEEYGSEWSLSLQEAAAQFAQKGFFRTWTDINGITSGGIYLTDALTESEVLEYIGMDKYQLHSIQESHIPSLILRLQDGTYILEVL